MARWTGHVGETAWVAYTTCLDVCTTAKPYTMPSSLLLKPTPDKQKIIDLVRDFEKDPDRGGILIEEGVFVFKCLVE